MNNTNTILLHANAVRSIDDQTLAVDVPGGTLTLIFGSRDKMRHTAAVVIAATDAPPVTIDEIAVRFNQASIGPIPRIPSPAPANAPESSDEGTATEDEDEIADLPILVGEDDDSDATESIGDVGLTQELNF